MNGQLYNPSTGVTATPNANVTPQQVAGAKSLGFTSPVPTTINASQVSNVTPLTLPQPPVNTSGNALGVTAGNVIGSANTDIANTATPTADTDTTNQGNQGILAYLKNLIGVESGKGTFTTNAQNEQDLAGKTQKLTDINNEALQTENSWNQQIQNARTASGGTVSGMNATEQDLQLKKNQDLANIGIRQKVAQGNLDAANEIINQKVSATFQPIEDTIKYLSDFYTMNQNDLSESEKMKLQSQLDTQKAKGTLLSTSYQDVLKTASANGAPQSVLQAIDKAASDPNATASTIYAAGGSWMQTKTQPGGANGTGFQEIDVSTITDKNASNKEWGGLSYNGLYNDAEKFLATGIMPSLGLGTAGGTATARFAIQNYAGQLADQLGMTQPQIQAMYKANSAAATNIINRMAKIDTISSSATTQFPRLADLADKVKTLGITEADIQKGAAYVKSKFGSVDASNYIELLQTIRGDYAGLQGAMGGSSQGGVFFNQKATDAIPAGLSGAQYLGIMQTMQTSAINVSNATQDEANNLIGIGSGNATGVAGGSSGNAKDGDTHVYNGTTYTLKNGTWTAN